MELKPEYIKNDDNRLGFLTEVVLNMPFEINVDHIEQLKGKGSNQMPEAEELFVLRGFTIDDRRYDLDNLQEKGIANPVVQKTLESYMVELGPSSELTRVNIPASYRANGDESDMKFNDFIFILTGEWKGYTIERASIPLVAGQSYVLPNDIAKKLQEEIVNRTKSTQQILAEADPKYATWIDENLGFKG